MTDMEVVGLLAEAVLSGDDERTLRVGYEVMIAAEYGAQEGAYDLYAEVAKPRLPRPCARADGPARRDRGARHERRGSATS